MFGVVTDIFVKCLICFFKAQWYTPFWTFDSQLYNMDIIDIFLIIITYGYNHQHRHYIKIIFIVNRYFILILFPENFECCSFTVDGWRKNYNIFVILKNYKMWSQQTLKQCGFITVKREHGTGSRTFCKLILSKKRYCQAGTWDGTQPFAQCKILQIGDYQNELLL